MNHIARLLGVGGPTKPMYCVVFNRGHDWHHQSRELLRLPKVPFPVPHDPEADGTDLEHYLCLDEAEDLWTVVVYTDGAWRVRYDPDTTDLDELNDWHFANWDRVTYDVPAELSDESFE